MKRALIFIVLVAAAAPAAHAAFVLTSKSLGPVETGVTYDKLERLVRGKVPYNEWANHGCAVVSTKEQEPFGISYMIEAKRLTRFNVDFYGTDPRPLTIKTDAGVGLGSSEEDVLKAYGARARVEPNPQDPTWHSITVDDPDHSHAVIFETNGKSVKSIRAGEYPGVSSRISCE